MKLGEGRERLLQSSRSGHLVVRLADFPEAKEVQTVHVTEPIEEEDLEPVKPERGPVRP